jgi:cytochrome c2
MQSLMAFRSTYTCLAVIALMLGGTAVHSTLQAAGLAGNPSSIGDPTQGRALIKKLGCGSCHDIPGVIGARGMVGPPLEHMASRQYIAGVLRNTPDNMMTWLRFPQRVVPGNAMPNLGISQIDARQIAAYLATLN